MATSMHLFKLRINVKQSHCPALAIASLSFFIIIINRLQQRDEQRRQEQQRHNIYKR